LGSVLGVNVFHIVSRQVWTAAVATGTYRPESLTTEGFIHFSYAEQVAATADRYYRDVEGLQVLELDPARLGAELILEPSPSTGELYPHLYAPMPTDALVALHPLQRDDSGNHVF
jgi:uncharacterized protein (DUF952 family)